MKARSLVVVIAVFAVIAAGCGSDSNAGDADSIGSTEATDDAPATGGEGGDSGYSSVQLSENVTIPLPDGGTVTASQTDTGYGYAYVEYPADRYDGLIEYYTQWTATDSRAWDGYDSGFGWVWNSDSSRFGVKECVAGGSGDTLNAACVEISEWAE